MTRYCGRDFTNKELDQIRSLIKENPQFHRAKLSREVCQMLQWLKPDGKLKDMSCRVAMLRMQEDGIIELPKPLSNKKGSSLPLTLINTVLYFPYLFFNFSVIFFKSRNSS